MLRIPEIPCAMISVGCGQILKDDARGAGKIGKPRGIFYHLVRHQIRCDEACAGKNPQFECTGVIQTGFWRGTY